MTGKRRPTRPIVEPLLFVHDESRLVEAYDTIEAIRLVRDEPSALMAMNHEVARTRPNVAHAAVSLTAWFCTVIATESLLIGLVTAPLVLIGSHWRNIRNASKIRRNRRLLPDLPECRSGWVTTTHRFMTCAHGFNARAEAVNTLHDDGLMPDATAKMACLLQDVRPRLLRVRDILEKLAPPERHDIFFEIPGYPARLEMHDPLRLRAPGQPFAWLETNNGFIEPDELEQVLWQDLDAIAAYKEVMEDERIRDPKMSDGVVIDVEEPE